MLEVLVLCVLGFLLPPIFILIGQGKKLKDEDESMYVKIKSIFYPWKSNTENIMNLTLLCIVTFTLSKKIILMYPFYAYFLCNLISLNFKGIGGLDYYIEPILVKLSKKDEYNKNGLETIIYILALAIYVISYFVTLAYILKPSYITIYFLIGLSVIHFIVKLVCEFSSVWEKIRNDNKWVIVYEIFSPLFLACFVILSSFLSI